MKKSTVLNFLGRGSGFYTKEGNTSAFVREDDKILLLDCGEGVFGKLQEHDLLKDVKDINVLVTHTHADHVGSLPTLALYSFFEKKKPLNIMLGSNTYHDVNIMNILEGMGCTPEMTNFSEPSDLDNKFETLGDVKYVPTSHVGGLDCYGIEFNTGEGANYYSGDTKDITQIKRFIDSGKRIDNIYADTTTAEYLGNVHLPLRELDMHIPEILRKKVFCMHFNSDDCINQAQKLGFQIAPIYGRDI